MFDLDTSNELFWMVWKGIWVHDVMQQAGLCAQGAVENSAGDISHLTFGALPMQPTHKRPKPLLQNHHVWSWYIQWMILDGFISSIKIRRKNLQWHKILFCDAMNLAMKLLVIAL
jgi:hypothetical protein